MRCGASRRTKPISRDLSRKRFSTSASTSLKRPIRRRRIRDELYVIASGSGKFVCAGETQAFATGDVLFVAAGVEHRFLDFTDDFAVWVIFFGARPQKPAH